jgi:hypothetical protein
MAGARAYGIVSVSLRGADIARAAESIEVVLLTLRQRIIRPDRFVRHLPLGEKACAIARHDAACRKRRAKVETGASSVKAVELQWMDSGIGRMKTANALFWQLGWWF